MGANDETRPIPREDETQPMPAQPDETLSTPAQPDESRPIPAQPDEARDDSGHIRVVSSGATAAPPTATPPAGMAPTAPPRAGVRVGTLVWGLVVVAVGAWLLAVVWGATIDAELALIVILGIAGVALLAGSLLGMRRSRSRVEGRG